MDTRHSRSTTELDAGPSPLGALNILGHLLDVKLQTDHPDRVRVRLSKDSTEARNLGSGREVELLTVDLDVLLDPVDAHRLDLGEVG